MAQSSPPAAARDDQSLAAMLPAMLPARLLRLLEPFEHADRIFEIKHDGFRGLAYTENGCARLLSRNGNTFKSFASLCAWLGPNVPVRNAVLDGEIVSLGSDGRAMFPHAPH